MQRKSVADDRIKNIHCNTPHNTILGTGDTGYWGIAIANHEGEEVILTKKYYAYGQYSKYIRPGYTIIASGDNTVAAYD